MRYLRRNYSCCSECGIYYRTQLTEGEQWREQKKKEKAYMKLLKKLVQTKQQKDQQIFKENYLKIN